MSELAEDGSTKPSLELQFVELKGKVRGIAEAVARIEARVEFLTPKGFDWVKTIGIMISVGSVLLVVMTAVVYPIKRDIDALAKTIETNREMTVKDLALVRSDFDAVKREMVWQWDAGKVHRENTMKYLDRIWEKVFGGKPEPVNGK